MKRIFLSLMLIMLSSMVTWSKKGDEFTVNTEEGVLMHFIVLNEKTKTCCVKNQEASKPAIPKETTGIITIPNYANGYLVTEINEYAFTNCTGITVINIPSSITYISSGVFSGTQWYDDLIDELPNGPIYIGNVLYGYKNSNTIPEGTDFDIKVGTTGVSDNILKSCANISSVTIPSSVIKVGQGAFSGSGLTTLTILSNNSHIMWNSFKDCANLSVINIPNDFSGIIEEGVFEGTSWYSSQDTGLVYLNKIAYRYKGAMPTNTEIILDEGTKVLANKVFYNCNNLKSVEIPSGVKTIGAYAFYGCSQLPSISIPNSVTHIGSQAFRGCSSLNSIIIPNQVSYLEQSTFQGCTNLIKAKLNEGVEEIGPALFYGCTSLAEITIPKSVKYIGIFPFYNCNNLTSVIVKSEIPISISSGIFPNSSNSTLYVPVGCTLAYEAADNWNLFKEIKEMTDDITIGAAGMGTYCSTHALDFSGTDDIKAYIVSAFKPSTGEVTLTRITDVPANTGIVVKGDADTYSIPWGPGETIVSNMLVGVTENTILNKEYGDYTNYILAKKNGNLGFYAVADGSTLSAGKAYLPLFTASLPSSGVRAMKLIFNDEETTAIKESFSNSPLQNDYYDLQGRRIVMPTKGVYIVNRKKIIIK